MNRRFAHTAFLLLLAAAVFATAVRPLMADRQQAEEVPLNKQVPYQPMGAPIDPKVPAQWNRYHDYDEATAMLKAMAKKHAGRAKLESLGCSHGGREMWLLTVTNFARGGDRRKPAFWIDGGIHANEIQGTQVALYTAWYLLEMYGRNEMMTRLVDDRAFYILAMLSPDSRDAHMYRPNTTSSPRSGQVPVDDDRDGLINEDGPDDLDNDGHITQMRVRDPHGGWKTHDEFPNLMVRVSGEEQGEYRLLGSEGIDNDGDGLVNEDGDGYYDPNRDWAWNWQPKHIQRGAYRYPFSLPENRAMADFVLDHPNIAGAQSYHNTGGMILRGPGAKADPWDPADIAVYDTIGKQGEVMLPAYRYISVGEDLYTVYGGQLDWLHAMRGIFTFSNELFTSFNYFRKARDSEGYFGRTEERSAFDKYLLFGQGTVPWHEVDHPRYGKVEIGGFKKQWVRQPPSFLLEEECHRNMAFTLYHADQMPQVVIESVAAERLGDGLLQVTATVVNRKITPTHAAVDVKHKITPPDLVSIKGKAVNVFVGLYASEPYFKTATEQRHRPSEMQIPNIPGRSVIYVRWLLHGERTAKVTVRSTKGGSDSRTVELEK